MVNCLVTLAFPWTRVRERPALSGRVRERPPSTGMRRILAFEPLLIARTDSRVSCSQPDPNCDSDHEQARVFGRGSAVVLGRDTRHVACRALTTARPCKSSQALPQVRSTKVSQGRAWSGLPDAPTTHGRTAHRARIRPTSAAMTVTVLNAAPNGAPQDGWRCTT